MVFDNSIVVEPWTLTSHMSLMTGLYPQHHGVGPEVDLPADIATLADRLKSAGYATAAFTDGGWMRDKWGLARGFDTYEGKKRRGFRAVLEEARAWVDEHAAERMFLFVHTYDVHGWGVRPFYRSPEPTLGTFSSDIDTELDLCFESEKDDLARGLVRKKLEAERLMKRLDSKHAANDQYLAEQRRLLDENTATLESLRQKAELLSQRTPLHGDGGSEFDDLAWMAREMSVGEDEIEIALLREKSLRSAS